MREREGEGRAGREVQGKERGEGERWEGQGCGKGREVGGERRAAESLERRFVGSALLGGTSVRLDGRSTRGATITPELEGYESALLASAHQWYHDDLKRRAHSQ